MDLLHHLSSPQGTPTTRNNSPAIEDCGSPPFENAEVVIGQAGIRNPIRGLVGASDIAKQLVPFWTNPFLLFGSVALKLIAGLLGVPYGRLYDREQRRRRIFAAICSSASLIMILELSGLTLAAFSYARPPTQRPSAQAALTTVDLRAANGPWRRLGGIVVVGAIMRPPQRRQHGHGLPKSG